MARASLMESQHHLKDLVDRGYITEPQRVALNALAEVALQETTGWQEYLQSPDAPQKRAPRARTSHRDAQRTAKPNPEPRTLNVER